MVADNDVAPLWSGLRAGDALEPPIPEVSVRVFLTPSVPDLLCTGGGGASSFGGSSSSNSCPALAADSATRFHLRSSSSSRVRHSCITGSCDDYRLPFTVLVVFSTTNR